MEQLIPQNNMLSDKEGLCAYVTVILIGNELYGVLGKNTISVEKNIPITPYPGQHDEGIMGMHNCKHKGKLITVYNLPRILDYPSFIQALHEMQTTRQDHVNFFNKLKKIVSNEINKLRGQEYDENGLDINSLQTDHTQCNFGKKLFKFIELYNNHKEIQNKLNEFINPHKIFHSEVHSIKEHFGNAEILENILNEIEKNIYPKLLKLFNEFETAIQYEIDTQRYIKVEINIKDIETGEIKMTTICLRVHKALQFCQLNFRKEETLGITEYIATDEENKLGLEKNGQKPMIQLLNLEEVMRNYGQSVLEKQGKQSA